MSNLEQLHKASAEQARLVLSLMDLTSLNEDDTPERIQHLCVQATASIVPVAAVCVYPVFVDLAISLLKSTPVRVATVVNFPKGNDNPETVFSDLLAAIRQGAHEIDVVFPYERYLAGDVLGAGEFIAHCKRLCGSSVLLKVILETGQLPSETVITAVSELAILSGADFIKTSTGKSPVGATLEAVRLMMLAIKKSQRPVGLKVSGGVRTLEQAEAYLDLSATIMGKEWLINAQTFRFGASQLWEACQQYV